MANRRMTSKDVCATSQFLTMPTSAQALYHLMVLEADDEGAVEAELARRKINVRRDSIQKLIDNEYILPLDPECCTAWIRHWNDMNRIKSDRFHQSIYHDQLQLIRSKYDGEKHNNCSCSSEKAAVSAGFDVLPGDILDPQVSTGKDSSGKCSDSEPLFTLGKETLTDTEYKHLCARYSRDMVDETINRIIRNSYFGCLNTATVSQWCEEAAARKKDGSLRRNSFNNIIPQHYDMDLIERKLMTDSNS